MKYTAFLNGKEYIVEIQRDGSVLLNGVIHQVDFLELGGSLYSIIQDTRSSELAIDEDKGNYEVLMEGRLYEAQILDQRSMLMAQRKGSLAGGSGEVHAPMPGLIVDIVVEAGATVAQGDTVVILESMKMQNELKAPCDGIVQSVKCQPGQTVDKGALLILIEPTAETT